MRMPLPGTCGVSEVCYSSILFLLQPRVGIHEHNQLLFALKEEVGRVRGG
ncbi:MAG: hypothetical protein BWZ07_03300 [Alphaproteobacteria bacterium ADurb.BinA280]|nr:MAG: hypothetical protein BWZ07_03300 [Alphaproteobacteria bacterium ADurb.BinA280]